MVTCYHECGVKRSVAALATSVYTKPPCKNLNAKFEAEEIGPKVEGGMCISVVRHFVYVAHCAKVAISAM